MGRSILKYSQAKVIGARDVDDNVAVGLSDLVILAQYYRQHYP